MYVFSFIALLLFVEGGLFASYVFSYLIFLFRELVELSNDPAIRCCERMLSLEKLWCLAAIVGFGIASSMSSYSLPTL